MARGRRGGRFAPPDAIFLLLLLPSVMTTTATTAPAAPQPSGSEQQQQQQHPATTQPKKSTAAKRKKSAAADGAAQSNSLLYGGHIGTTSTHPPPPGWRGAGGGQRRTLPENILPFKLPTYAYGEDRTDTKRADDGVDDDSDEGSDAEPSSKRQRAEDQKHQTSLLINQSLRQSRLFYMASLLPPHSHRTKVGIQYPPSIPESQLHGMVPAQKNTYNIVPLGRIHIQLGPHLFANTRLFEMTTANLAPPGAAVRAHSPAASSSKATPQTSPKATPPKKAASKKTTAKKAKGPVAAAAATSSSSSARSSPAQSPPRPPQQPAPATARSIDPVLVQRVNAKAALDPGLRDLLQVAAKGQASPEQLRDLGLVIAKVTREMEAEGLKVQTPGSSAQTQSQPAAPSSKSAAMPKMPRPPAGNGSTSAGTKAKGKGKARASVGASSETADQAEASATASAKKAGEPTLTASDTSAPTADATSTAPAPSSTSTAGASQPTAASPPPKAHRPPILLIEFREAISHRYYLPVWSSAVTRSMRRKVSAKQTLDMIDGLGDDAEQGEDLLVGEEIDEDGSIRDEGSKLVDGVEVEMKFVAPLIGSDAAAAGAGIGEGASAGDRDFPVTLRFTATAPARGSEGETSPLDALWEAVGRIPGVVTTVAEKEGPFATAQPAANPTDAAGNELDAQAKTQREEEEQRKRDREHLANIESVLTRAFARLPPPLKIDLSADSSRVPAGLDVHLSDNFAPSLGSTSSFAIAGQVDGRRKQHHQHLDLSSVVVGTSTSPDADVSMSSINDANESSASLRQPRGSSPSAKPKRKPRPVATHNPDGTLKRCSSCATHTTPMWRRGPLGVGTLCNACGAKWKCGRLAVPVGPHALQKAEDQEQAQTGSQDAGAKATPATPTAT